MVDSMRMNNVDSQWWDVKMAGEGSIDAGGVFRDVVVNMCQEVCSTYLPLLLPTPNNKNQHGQFRECWAPNPSATSQVAMQMFRFLGQMIGAAIRGKTAMPLDLAPSLWKAILGEDLTINDLKDSDTFSWQVLDGLKNEAEKLSDEEFEAVVG